MPRRDTTAHAPSIPEPGTPPGLGDPAHPDTVGGTEGTTDRDHSED
jgi:proteasome alpha subunit